MCKKVGKVGCNCHIVVVRRLLSFRSNTGGYDLYIPGDGRWEIETKAIDCPTVPGQDGNIMFRFVENNLWSFKLQARNIK